LPNVGVFARRETETRLDRPLERPPRRDRQAFLDLMHARTITPNTPWPSRSGNGSTGWRVIQSHASITLLS
jgi:hypothetical protein